MQPPDSFDPPIGIAQTVAPRLRRIVAPNPSPMTYRGTNTYLVGEGDLALIDPGPAIQDHQRAILAALLPGERITHIVVTHAHVDHSPLARPLADATGAPIYAFGDAISGRSAVMQRLAETGMIAGGEGVDLAFIPDKTVSDNDIIEGESWSLRVVHTPGHLGNHISLAFGDICLTGDHVMGWASSLVSPPDGDLTDFMASCEKLSQERWTRFFPGHGDAISHPAERLSWLIKHRRAREAAILDQLANGPNTASSLAKAIYTDTPAPLLPAATRNVLAHLIDLMGREMAAPIGPLSETARFERVFY